MFVILRYTAGPIVKRFMGYKYKKQKGPDKPSLIVSNHNTFLDSALVALAFSRHMYFLASEHAFRAGLPSKILKFAFAPIPINKVKTDISAVKEMIRRLKNGANVCLFAEGDRSFNGLTGPIAMSTAKLAKTSGADLITYRLEGSYFVTPRWSKNKRKGIINGVVVNTYTSAEIKAMTVDEVYDVIKRDLYEDAYKRQKENPCLYTGKGLAENIETVLYLCPECKEIGTIKSGGDRFYCGCGLEGVYTDTGFLEGEKLPFSTITEWDLWQAEQLAEIVNSSADGSICVDEEQQLFKIRPAIDKTLAGEGQMYINKKIFSCAGMSIPIENITKFAVTDQMELLFANKNGDSYEVRSQYPRSALKYREIFRVLTGDQ